MRSYLRPAAVAAAGIAIVAAGLHQGGTGSKGKPATTGIYYVDPGSVGGTCSDAYTATQAQVISTPWCSVDAAADNSTGARPAGLVYVRGGSYEHFEILGECRTTWVTFKPYPGETVVLDGETGGTNDFDGAWELNDDCYIRIQGFELTDRFFLDSDQDNIEIRDNWVHSKDGEPDTASGAANVTVSGVVLRCSGGGCASGQTNVTIVGNHFEDIAYGCLGTGDDLLACDTNDQIGSGYGYCFNIPTGTVTGLIVSGNHFDGCWEDGIQGLGSGSLVEDNRFNEIGGPADITPYATHSDGIQVFSTGQIDDVIIRRNVWSGRHSSCLRIQNGPRDGWRIENNVCGTSDAGRCFDLEDLSNVIIRYNTCGSTQFGFSFEDDSGVSGVPDGVVIEDNVFDDATGAANSVGIANTTTNLTYRYNLVTEPPGSGLGAIANCTPGCITTGPTYLIETNGADHRLASGSAGLNVGVAVAGISDDALGRTRPVGTPDMGAYERQPSDP